MTDLDLAAIQARAERSYDETIRICSVNSNNRPKMSIPANPEKDTDLILTATFGDVKDLLAEVAQLRTELADAQRELDEANSAVTAAFVDRNVAFAERDAARAELARWESGQRRKALPVVEQAPDGIEVAARLVRAQYEEDRSTEAFDQLLVDAGLRLKALHDVAATLLAEAIVNRAELDRLRDLEKAAREYCEVYAPVKPGEEFTPEEGRRRWQALLAADMALALAAVDALTPPAEEDQ